LEVTIVPKQENKNSDVAKMSFEKAIGELETIVDRLERGDVELETSISIYERGEALRQHCDTLLKQAEAKVEKISIDESGKPCIESEKPA
jgi:exodeoxyribonuclease VII small subunit